MDGHAHGSGNGGPGSGPSNHHLLQVQPGAIPELRAAFAEALDRVDRQLELADADLRVSAWANDPVSMDATARFNERSVDTLDSAMDMLRAYRHQLSAAVHNLDRTAEQYDRSDQDNSVTVGSQGEDGSG